MTDTVDPAIAAVASGTSSDPFAVLGRHEVTVDHRPAVVLRTMQPGASAVELITADAVTPMPGLVYTFLLFTVLYCFLGVIVAWLLYRQIIRSPRPDEWSRQYDPRKAAHV